VAIETDDGGVVEALDQPRASFAGHTPETPWSTLQLAYFVGTAMWTYLTQPFTFTLPGFETSELEPWDEAGQQWRRLRVAWPSYLATHSSEQTLYLNSDGRWWESVSSRNASSSPARARARVCSVTLASSHRFFLSPASQLMTSGRLEIRRSVFVAADASTNAASNSPMEGEPRWERS
jgi:hypothetical protein